MRGSARGMVVTTASCILAIACAATSYATASGDRAALDTAGKAWVEAFNARDADAMAALTTEDVVVLPPNAEPVRGREAVRSLWLRAVESARAEASVTVEESVVFGDYAYRTGGYVYTLPNGVEVERGKFLEIWKRTDAGWRIHRDMFSSNRPFRVPPPEPPPSEPRMDSQNAR